MADLSDCISRSHLVLPVSLSSSDQASVEFLFPCPALLLVCFFWWGGALQKIIVPQLVMELMPPALDVWSLNHWTVKEVPSLCL